MKKISSMGLLSLLAITILACNGGSPEAALLLGHWDEATRSPLSGDRAPQLENQSAGRQRSLLLPAGSQASFPLNVGGAFRLSFDLDDSSGDSIFPVVRLRSSAGRDLELEIVENDSSGEQDRYYCEVSEDEANGWCRLILGSAPEANAVRLVEPQLTGNVQTSAEALQGVTVVLFVAQGIRAGHLSAYRYNRDTTPHFDQLAAEGARFRTALAAASWERSSVASLLSSLLPKDHGILHRSDFLRAEIDTLPEILNSWGFQTVAVVADGNISPSFGFDQGFESFRFVFEKPPYARAEEVFQEALTQVSETDPDRPLFLFIATMDAHLPFAAPEPYTTLYAPASDIARAEDFSRKIYGTGPAHTPPAQRNQLRALYDGEIRYTDDSMGSFLHELGSRRSPDRTLFVYTSGHGEQFGDHGHFGHGISVHMEEIQVPLLFHQPGVIPGGSVLRNPVSLMDVAPTILAVLDLPRFPGFHGFSLAEELKTAVSPESRPVFSENRRDKRLAVAVTTADWKYIYFPISGKGHLYDMNQDRGETKNMIFVKEEIGDEMNEILIEAYGEGLVLTAPSPLPALAPAVREQLDDLGELPYLPTKEKDEDAS